MQSASSLRNLSFFVMEIQADRAVLKRGDEFHCRLVFKLNRPFGVSVYPIQRGLQRLIRIHVGKDIKGRTETLQTKPLVQVGEAVETGQVRFGQLSNS